MAKTYTQLTAANATAGNAILASDHSAAFTNINNLRVPPICVAVSNATKTLTNNTWVTLDFQTEDYDTDGMHDNSTFNSRITPTTAGLYLFNGYLVAAGNPTIGIAARFYKNGSVIAAQHDSGGSSFVGAVSPCALISMNGSTDYVEFQIYWSSTGNGTANSGARFTATWLGQVS